MPDFERAAARAHRFARRLLAEGFAADVVVDAMMTEALAAWAASSGHHDVARKLTVTWALIRDAANGQ